ncbi:molybdopterin molybdotransferase MoeA [Caloranaerobacter sp. DY30410]|uniref:molybdopterin molybdotransferase MoeA n=1 Tax=Caloranaerobacter sp. DY30410 TaxID=3238305 RepID=UPI003D052980
MDFFKVVSVESARKMIVEKFMDFKLDIQEIEITKVLGRVLAEDVISDINVPEFNRSTVDGYAIISSDSHGATDTIPSFLNLIGEVKMGSKTELKITYGEAVYVPTGGMIPEGADGVIMIENVEIIDENTIAVLKPITPGENIIRAGDDIKKGSVVLKRGKRLEPQDIGVLAAIGLKNVKVYRKPKFYIISTGDELIDLDEKLDFGKIRDINGYSLSALVQQIGGEVVKRVIVRDDFNLLKKELEKAIELSDIILISGGSSVGNRDYTCQLINSFQGEGVFIHGVSIKPGKPTIVGEVCGKIVFGLPGHPVSSIIIFKVFVEYLVRKIMGMPYEINKTKAVMDFNIHSFPGRETYQMVTLEERQGKIFAKPNYGKSGMITLLSNSNGYVIIKSDEEGLNKGDERDVYFL